MTYLQAVAVLLRWQRGRSSRYYQTEAIPSESTPSYLATAYEGGRACYAAEGRWRPHNAVRALGSIVAGSTDCD